MRHFTCGMFQNMKKKIIILINKTYTHTKYTNDSSYYLQFKTCLRNNKTKLAPYKYRGRRTCGIIKRFEINVDSNNVETQKKCYKYFFFLFLIYVCMHLNKICLLYLLFSFLLTYTFYFTVDNDNILSSFWITTSKAGAFHHT